MKCAIEDCPDSRFGDEAPFCIFHTNVFVETPEGRHVRWAFQTKHPKTAAIHRTMEADFVRRLVAQRINGSGK